MAQLTINIPDDEVNRVLAAFVANYAKPGEVPPDEDSTMVQKGKFVKDAIKTHIVSLVRNYEASKAAEAANRSTRDSIADDLVT